MAKLIFALNASLDGCVDHMRLRQTPCLFVISSTMCTVWPAPSTVAACMR